MSNLSNISLLYVEDEVDIVEFMKELLEDEVKELYIASNGEDGLKLYKEKKPDIVLSDIYMPKLTGLQMSEKIKEFNPNQPIILLTAFNNIEDLKKAISIGIDSYINKPIYNDEELNKPLEKIANVLYEKEVLKKLSIQIENQSKYAAIGEVLGYITHQWKQPLSVISSKIINIKLDKELGIFNENTLDEFMDEVTNQIEYLSQTITDFKDYLKPKEDLREFSIQSVFKMVKSLISARLIDSNIELILPTEELISTGYDSKLIHVLINIIQNAIDAINETNSTKRVIKVTLEDSKDDFTLNIMDSAGGIPENIRANIFNAYFTTKPETIGTGLGLYMAYDFIVGHMGGTIEVNNREFDYENEKLSGAYFSLKIPKKEF